MNYEHLAKMFDEMDEADGGYFYSQRVDEDSDSYILPNSNGFIQLFDNGDELQFGTICPKGNLMTYSVLMDTNRNEVFLTLGKNGEPEPSNLPKDSSLRDRFQAVIEYVKQTQGIECPESYESYNKWLRAYWA